MRFGGDGASLGQSREILFLQQLHCVDAWVATGSITLTIFFFFPKAFVAGMEAGPGDSETTYPAMGPKLFEFTCD